MKLTDISWRSRIGRFRGIKATGKSFVGVNLITTIQELLPVLVSGILLIISGVELNPGPSTNKVTFMEVSLRDIKANIDSCSGNKNYRHCSSKWGRLSQILFGNNSLNLRQFLFNVHESIPPGGMLKYCETTLGSILAKLNNFTDTDKSVVNSTQTNSVWGHLAVEIFGTNSSQDRQVLSTFWAIGNQVEEIGEGRFKTLLPKPGPTGDKIKRKRCYDKTVKKPRGKTKNTPPHLIPTPDEDHSDSLLHRLNTKYNKDIHQFPSFPCEVCDFMVYPNHNFRHKLKVKDELRAIFAEVDKEYSVPDELIVCNRCHANMTKRNPQIPAKAKINLLSLRPVPKQIEILTMAEIRLIVQVKAFMKIYLLCNGRGQKAMKGLVVHFPQQVDEVINQLPLNSCKSDLIVVHEKHDRVEHITALKVRPKVVYDALAWLVVHNPLYTNIQINNDHQFNEFQSITLDKTEMPTGVSYEGANSSYREVSPGIDILHASFSQGHRIFLNNAGKQCTAMAASFLAHSFIDSPISWCRQTLDDVLLLGNDLYTERRSLLNHNHDYLANDEVTGPFRAFGGAEVNLGINSLTPAIGFWGYATKVPGPGLPRLKQQIQNFISGGYKFGMLTFAEYSMGIYVDGEFTYYFDSHSRGQKGCSTRGGEGSACVMKLRTDLAPSKISTLANRNCIPANVTGIERDDLRFYLSVFDISMNRTEEEGMDEVAHISPPPSQPNSPPRKIFHEEEIASESESDTSDVEEVHPSQLPDFGRILESDCVIDRDDLIEPEIDAIVNDPLSLNREDRSPINDYLERNLDLLAFPQLFPYGVNGLHARRKITITTLDYFQQRLMSSEKRFSGNTDFLFYALSESDKCRAREKIGIVGKQKRQVNPGADDDDLGVRDPHVYMSSIRGTSSYWKKYTGDLISMVKTLGVPTFFITTSFDDINSPDCINALWKAKYGYDTPDVNPEEIEYQDRKALLNEYPIAAARHFSMRLSKLIALWKAHSTEIFGLELLDYSVRVEFQARGSPHAHCLLWLKDAPAWTTPEGIQLLEKNVSCSTSTSIKDFVLKYQRHAHSKTCFKNKNHRCRFDFPKQLAEETTILNDDEIVKNKGRFFNLRRSVGEEMVNSYHPILLPLLKCNMDIQPVTGAVAIAYYIAKYMGKPETAAIQSNISETISKIQESGLPARQKMFKVAMTLMRNREISAQEAAFRICHLFLRYSSRSTVFLPTFRKENRVRMLKKESYARGIPEFCTNIIDRYMGRPPIFEHMCLYEFAAELALLPKKKSDAEIDDNDLVEFPEELPEENQGSRLSFGCTGPNGESLGRVFVRRTPAVVKHPNFNPITDKESYYYSLLLLYRPFRNEEQWDGQDPCVLFENERANFRNHSHNPNLRADLADEIDRAILRIAEFNDEDRENVNLDNEFDAGFEQPEMSGTVPSPAEAFREEERNPNIADQIKEMHTNLNSQQKGIFRLVHEALQSSASNFRLMVLANAGTGKSHLLRLLALLIRNMISHDALLIAAPTGKAAFPVGGGTCHSIFGLQVQHGFIKSYQKLSAKRLADFRRLYRNVQWIFIDEISMVSYENFRAIHMRLCEIFGTDGAEPMAGKNVLIFGDLLQIPPVKASRIFKNPFPAEVDLWRQFKFSELTINMRQRHDPLGKICDELRVGELSEESLRLLKTRLTYNETDFVDAVRIYPQNDQCKIFNNQKTKELRKTRNTFLIQARDFFADGPKQGQPYLGQLPKGDDLTGGIPSAIQLAVGSRVMLRKNISTEKGYVNGATGVVRQIEWRIDKHRQIEKGDLPKRVSVLFDHDGNEQWISCTTVDFTGKKQDRVSREMIPLVLAWALTCHKLQGATLEKAVVYLGPKCTTKGLAYVAISRVKTLNGLAIEELDPRKLLTTKTFNPADSDALNELERLRGTLENNLNVERSNIPFVDDNFSYRNAPCPTAPYPDIELDKIINNICNSKIIEE